MKNLKRIVCAALALICCFGAIFVMSACDGEQTSTGGNWFYVEYKSIRIELDKSADEVLAALGEAKYTENLGDCGGIGVQTKYTYSDISVNTLKEQSGEKIHKISFLNDLVRTPEGIYIGASEQAVRDAYGEPTSFDGSRLTYKRSDLKLEFKIKDAKVSAIDFIRVR